MPLVEVSETIEAPIDAVWSVVSDVERYPELMSQVQTVRIVEVDGPVSVVAWEVELKGSLLCWSEREQRDDTRHVIEFAQVDGDLEVFDGSWRLVETPEGHTTVHLSVTFEIGIPMLRDMLDPVAAKAIRNNSLSMLASIGASAVSSS